jgi:hypothetical protein
MNAGRRSGRVLAVVGLALAAVGLSGCESLFGKSTPADAPVVKADGAPARGQRKPLPSYASIVARWNDRVDGLDRLLVRANLLVDYFDENGELQRETPEGRLQVVRPDRLALSLGKAGSTMFWFGCDPDRYWWLDMSDDADRVAAVGRHANFDKGASRRLGLAVRPLDLIRVLGITPLDPAAKPLVAWNDDQTLVVLTLTGTGDEGAMRLFLAPGLFMPRTIELYGPDGAMEVVAQHEGEERVEITRQIAAAVGARPPISGRITVRHLSSDTQIRLTMTGAKDGPVSDRAFVLDELIKSFAIKRTVDLDAPARRPSPQAAPTTPPARRPPAGNAAPSPTPAPAPSTTPVTRPPAGQRQPAPTNPQANPPAKPSGEPAAPQRPRPTTPPPKSE